jgi:hypothetical protein
VAIIEFLAPHNDSTINMTTWCLGLPEDTHKIVTVTCMTCTGAGIRTLTSKDLSLRLTKHTFCRYTSDRNISSNSFKMVGNTSRLSADFCMSAALTGDEIMAMGSPDTVHHSKHCVASLVSE